MKLFIPALLTASAAAFAPTANVVSNSKTSLSMSAKAEMVELAGKLNPIVKYFDPLNLADQEFWGKSNDETVRFLRESEVKHGRIAMFAFVGYIVHANGITWPWPMTLEGDPFPAVSNAPEAWDAIPEVAKLQIMGFIGFLEVWSEAARDTHYMKGGKIGDFPDFDADYIPGGALNLFDPFGYSKNKSEEAKAAGLVREINNGRLAQLGIFGFLCEAKIPGSVPALTGIIPAYDGEPMAPLSHSILMPIPGL